MLKTTEDIYLEYDGRDKPEQIKYFIKDAVESFSISYVLLIGGRVGQQDDWYVPVRYHNFYDNPEHPLSVDKLHDPGVVTDLYYADIYKEGGEFENWDSNGDGILAKYSMTPGKDTLDLNPDVYVGRLPCRNTMQVKKIVNYINYNALF